MTRSVNVVVTCTKRKAKPVLSQHRLRQVGGRSVAERARRWIARLDGEKGERVPACNLYQGDHWSVVSSLPDAAAKGGVEAKVWVLSAGYGLIPWEAPLLPYSATFSRDHADSVTACAERLGEAVPAVQAAWWESLSSWSGPLPGAPRRLAEIVQADPRASLLVIGSSVYLRAAQRDLTEALDALPDPAALSIVSSGSDDLGVRLTPHMIPSDARLRASLGGGMNSLNARVARKILEEARRWPVRSDALQPRYRRLLAAQQDLVSYDRRPMDDAQVRQFIADALRKDASAKKSPLLRRLRDGGRACEQKRFGALFETVKAEFLEVQKEVLHGA